MTDGDGNYGYRGADGSFIPFSSGGMFPTYKEDMFVDGNYFILNGLYESGKYNVRFYVPKDGYFYILAYMNGIDYPQPEFVADKGDILAYGTTVGTYAGRRRQAILHTTSEGICTLSYCYQLTIVVSIDKSMITTPTNLGYVSSISATPGKYYIATEYSSSGNPYSSSDFPGATLCSTMNVPVGLLKATSSTITRSAVYMKL